MNKEEFTKELVDIISRCLGELYLVEEKCITKNNNTKFQAISIQAKGKDAAMLIYVDELFKNYHRGRCIYDIVDEILDLCHGKYPHYDSSIVDNLLHMLDKIYCKFINTEANAMFLYDTPHKEWNDLSIVYYFYLGQEDDIHQTVTISNKLLKLLGLSLEALDQLAMANTKRDLYPRIQDLGPLYRKSNEYDMETLCDKHSLHIVTNSLKISGAIGVLFEECLADFARRMNATHLWVIPSSIHEMLLLVDDGTMDSRYIRQTIHDVNVRKVAPEEVLSWNCYFYDSRHNTITVA